MARIAGVNIPTNKRVIIALTYIHGIGPHKARQIVDKLGIDHSRRVQDLTDQEVLHIRETIDAEHTVYAALAALSQGNQFDKKRLPKEIKALGLDPEQVHSLKA